MPRIINARDFIIITTDSVVNKGTLHEMEHWRAQQVEDFHSPSICSQLCTADVNWASKTGISGKTRCEYSGGANVGAKVGFYNGPQARTNTPENPSPPNP